MLTKSLVNSLVRPLCSPLNFPAGVGISPTLKYDFANDVSLVAAIGPTLSLTRTTAASVTDYNGVIKQVQSGEARYTGGRRVENIAPQSNSLDQAGWTAISCTTTASAVVGPFGDSDVWEIKATDTADTGTSGPRQDNWSDGGAYKEGNQYTCSVYAKKGTLDWIRLSLTNDTPVGSATQFFDLANGVEGTMVSLLDVVGLRDGPKRKYLYLLG